jgi:hypothetical protein
MKWYIAKLVFNINISNGKDTAQFDEQLRLIEAVSPADAFFRARTIGKKEEDEFVNSNNDKVSWNFIDVADIKAVPEFSHGTPVYSFTHVDQDAGDYINFIRRKAMYLQSRDVAFA